MVQSYVGLYNGCRKKFLDFGFTVEIVLLALANGLVWIWNMREENTLEDAVWILGQSNDRK